MIANGSVNRNADPHQKSSSNQPAINMLSADAAPPTADQSAIERVRPGPFHSAVISASVVGYAIPAASPPRIRASTRTPTEGA